MRRALALLLLLAGCAAPVETPTPSAPPPAPDRIAELVEILAGGSLEEREQAERELAGLGPPVEGELARRVAAATDAEVRARLESALERIAAANLERLPTEGTIGEVRITLLHSFAWQAGPEASRTFVSTVWELRNGGAATSTIRIARARMAAGGTVADVKATGTKLDPDPVYELSPGRVWKPAIKMPEGPASAAGSEAWAVLEFADDSGRRLRLRCRPAVVERTD